MKYNKLFGFSMGLLPILYVGFTLSYSRGYFMGLTNEELRGKHQFLLFIEAIHRENYSNKELEAIRRNIISSSYRDGVLNSMYVTPRWFDLDIAKGEFERQEKLYQGQIRGIVDINAVYLDVIVVGEFNDEEVREMAKMLNVVPNDTVICGSGSGNNKVARLTIETTAESEDEVKQILRKHGEVFVIKRWR